MTIGSGRKRPPISVHCVTWTQGCRICRISPKTFFYPRPAHTEREPCNYALTLHFREAGIETEMLPFPFPEPLAADNHAGPTYALGCTIDEFSLFSLRRYQQVRVGSRRLALPVRGPTRAGVSLSLSLYQLPSGRVVWQERVWGRCPRSAARGARNTAIVRLTILLTLALSRAVGRILSIPNFQAALRLSHPDAALAQKPYGLRFSRPQAGDLLTHLGDKRRSGDLVEEPAHRRSQPRSSGRFCPRARPRLT